MAHRQSHGVKICLLEHINQNYRENWKTRPRKVRKARDTVTRETATRDMVTRETATRGTTTGG